MSQNLDSTIITSTDNQGTNCHKTGVPQPWSLHLLERKQLRATVTCRVKPGRVLPEVLKVTCETVAAWRRLLWPLQLLKSPVSLRWLAGHGCPPSLPPQQPPHPLSLMFTHLLFILVPGSFSSSQSWPLTGHTPQPCLKQAPNPSASSEDVHSSQPVSCSLCHPSGIEVFSPQHLPGN